MGEDPIASEATPPASGPDPVADGTKNDVSDGATKDPTENPVPPNTEAPKDGADASQGGPPIPVYLPPGSNELPVEERVAKPGVRYYNYQGFVNRLDSDGEDFGIEVLVTGTDWHEEVSIENHKRWEPSPPPPPPVPAQPPTTQQPEQPTVDVTDATPKQPSPPLHVENPSTGYVPYYIRNRVSEYLAADPLEKKYSFSDKIEFLSGSESILEGRTHYEEDDEGNEYTTTTWSMYSLDYDGEILVPVWKSFRFLRFDGERDITSLGCYPLEFDSKGAKILEEQKVSGERFKSCLTGKWKHFFYLGWTFITGLRGEFLEDEKGNFIQHPEYIESEIVVDFKETLQSYPGWETEHLSQSLARNSWDWDGSAQHQLRIWEEDRKGSHGRRRYRVVYSPILIEESELYRREADKWQAQDVFLSGKADFKSKDWSAEDFALLPKRVFAYVLRERRFARLDVAGIDLDTEQSNVTLDDIQMDHKRRRMIRSSVSAHFRDKNKPSTSELDMFRGKGKGLVILLHGAPGVGKTATAEAVAAENNRPLFPITCGDLGFSPGEVDKALRDIFRYAHLWTCILLFDEADVFLTQRDRSGGNLERNALVGVFLRVLEYYSGILFMTTNRVGALDEAFQSRVHLSLSYPNLSLDDTIEILRFNLDRLPRINKAEGKTAQGGYLKIFDKPIIEYVSKEYEDYNARTKKNRGPWNGRQIRNAVQIAAGLALYEKQTGSGDNDDEDDPPYLTAEHFRAVADMTYEFEDYLSLSGKGDAQVQARRRRDRADQFHGSQSHDNPVFEKILIERRNALVRVKFPAVL
ncbi:AAA family ATPase [Colletotrichum asianum]